MTNALIFKALVLPCVALIVAILDTCTELWRGHE